MVALTFPDGVRREFPNNITGTEVADSSSKSLAKKAVAIAVDGRPTDLGASIEHDAKIEIDTRDDPRALELNRHDSAHVPAEAGQTQRAGTQGTIRPVLENGFYYDS